MRARSRGSVCVGAGARSRWRVYSRVTLLIQHATRMRHIVPSAASLAPQYFSTLPLKRHNLWEKVTEHKMFILILSTTFV